MVMSQNKTNTGNDSKPKYTKPGNNNEKFCGQHRKDIKRYNQSLRIVKTNREKPDSKEIDIHMQSIYAQLCGKGRRIYDINVEINLIVIDDDTEGFDIFVG